MTTFKTSLLSLFLLLALAGCGGEQFGVSSQTEKTSPNGLEAFEQVSCTNHTVVKPKVDIVYFVDNSSSTAYVPADLKTAITKTVNTVSTTFDYRIIGTSLITLQDNDYNIMTNSSDRAGINGSKEIITSEEFNFFKTTSSEPEYGLRRVNQFIATHKSSGLIRSDSHLIIVVVSNGRDIEVERQINYYNPATGFICVNGDGASAAQAEESGCSSQGGTVFKQRLNTLNALKQSSASLRFVGISAQTSCKNGWLSSEKSYYRMASSAYNLCNQSISTVFADVNESLKLISIPHKYKYWAITASNDPSAIDPNNVHVYKNTPSQPPTKLDMSAYEYYPNLSSASVRITTADSPAEYSTAKHFVKFNDSNVVVYPECVSIVVTNKLEFFGFIVIPKKPDVTTIALKINGKTIAQSETDGWSYIAYQQKNVKVAYQSYPATPEIVKTGYMILLNGSNNYYKSGDSVEISYTPETK